MKNTKVIFFIAVLIFAVSAITTPKKAAPITYETQTICTSTVSDAKKQIDSYTKSGYRVKFMVSQSVGTSVNSNGYKSPQRDISGWLIIVLEKEK